MSGSVLVQDLPEDDKKKLHQYRGKLAEFRRVGDAGYVLPSSLGAQAEVFRRILLRPDDVWVNTFPRSGTTMTQEIIWLIQNNLDYESASETTLDDRYHFVEFPHIHIDRKVKRLMNDGSMPEYDRLVDKRASPRFLKTHLPLSLLPPSLLDTCKVVYVARDPRDIAVSFYHHSQIFEALSYSGDFKSFWQLFTTDLILYTPYFSHVKAAWAQRRHPNMLFIFYEEMIKDMSTVIRRIASHLGKEYSEVDVQSLCNHMQFDKFRNNESVNRRFMENYEKINRGVSVTAKFIREGRVGGWREYFDESMLRQAQEWMALNLCDTDLSFPST